MLSRFLQSVQERSLFLPEESHRPDSDDRKYLLKPSEVDANKDIPLGFRMLLLSENTTEKLTLDDLLEHGLKWVPQGGPKVKEPLLSHILGVFE